MIVNGSGPHIVKYLQDRVESLKEKLDLAQARIDELEKAFGSEDELKPLFMLGLTASEAKIVHLLRTKDTVTRDQLFFAVYADGQEYERTSKTIDVFASKARKKLDRLGITFGSIGYGSGSAGYRMPGPDKARLAKLIASGARMVVRGRPDRKYYRKLQAAE